MAITTTMMSSQVTSDSPAIFAATINPFEYIDTASVRCLLGRYPERAERNRDAPRTGPPRRLARRPGRR